MNRFGFSGRRSGKQLYINYLIEQALDKGKTVAMLGLENGRVVVKDIRGPNVAKDITPATPAKPLRLEKK